MASRVVMPKLSDTMEEGRILRWLRKEGDKVETGQALAEVETDKATVEMEAYTNGVVRKLIAKDGDTVPVGQLIAVVGGPDEDISALLAETKPSPAVELKAEPAQKASQARPAEPVEAPSRAQAATPREPAPPAPGGRAVRASPLALRMASEAGLDLNAIKGTGPQGRVIKRDIEEAARAQGAPPEKEAVQRPRAAARAVQVEGGPEVQEIPLTSMRRTIAKRLAQSLGPVPHFYLTVDVALEKTWDAYRALRAAGSEISLNDIIIKAVASALRRHPELNASFAGDHVKQYARVHIGLAVAIEDGLITPVIRDADTRSLEEISEEAKALADRARQRRLQPHEYTGATFSISNLGMMGIEEFSAIINPPEGAILAIGAVREVPVVRDGALVPGRRMKMTLSVDHRVADGATGAKFLQTLVRILENPLLV